MEYGGRIGWGDLWSMVGVYGGSDLWSMVDV